MTIIDPHDNQPLDASNPNHAYHLGFAEALLFVQAAQDTPAGRQTLITHLPDATYSVQFDIKLLNQAIIDLNDECMITQWRFVPIPNHPEHHTIEIASSEGHHGLPDWDDPQN